MCINENRSIRLNIAERCCKVLSRLKILLTLKSVKFGMISTLYARMKKATINKKDIAVLIVINIPKNVKPAFGIHPAQSNNV